MATRKEIEFALRYWRLTSPTTKFGAIADHAMDSCGLCSAAPETAAWLSMVCYIRHALTEYDLLLEEGYEQENARHFVANDMRTVLKEWGVRRP